MKTQYTIPTFAIIGHPNEGKSTIVSTLAEDDKVRVSPVPGETVECIEFPVKIDGVEIIRFIDTPGFQNPRKTLAWIHNFDGNEKDLLQSFLTTNKENPDFSDETKLLTPVSKGSGIIYIVDGSRPVRKVDTIEMEILRLTGQPRIAIINNKEENLVFIEDWKRAFLKHFNAVRIFNGHTATYTERIELLESLKAIFQDWQEPLSTVIEAFKNDWEKRNKVTSYAIIEMLVKSIRHKEKEKINDDSKISHIKAKQLKNYKSKINSLEKETCSEIKKLFKHNIFNYNLPSPSVLPSDLFDAESIKILGLRPNQIALAGGVTGGMIGAAADIAAHGLSFGLFTAIGGASGAGYAFLNRDKMVKTKVAGLKIGRKKITTGPCRNIQFMYIQLDRILLYYSHVINWAHGRRDNIQDKTNQNNKTEKKMGIVTHFSDETRKVFDTLFFIVAKGKKETDESEKKAAQALEKILEKISLKK